MASRPTRLAAGGSLLLGSVVTGTAVDLHPASAIGTTITVDSLADGPVVTGDCFDLTPGNCTLRDAITISNYLAGRDTITFDPALTGSIVLTSNLEYLSDGVVIEGPGVDVLTVDGSGQYSGFTQLPVPDPVTHRFPEIDLDLSGLTLTGMSSATPPHFSAVAIISGNLHAHDLVITQSGSRTSSGYFVAPISVGLIGYAAVSNLQNSSVVLERVTVTDNHGSVATPGYGNSLAGSIVVLANTIEMTDCQITNNSADRLAGPVLFGYSVEVHDSLVDGNVALHDGAGLLVISGATLVTGTVITHNSASTLSGLGDYGSFEYAFGEGGGVIRDTVVAYNHVLYGPTVLVGAHHTDLDRVSIVDNVSEGILPPTEVNAPSSNYAGDGATVSIRGDATISSSTIADNVGAAIVVSDHNLNSAGSAAVNSSSSTTPTSAIGRLLSGVRGRRAAAGANNAPTSPPVRPSSIVLSHSTMAGNTRGGIIEGVHNEPLTAGQVLFDHAIVTGNGALTLDPSDVSVPFSSRFSLIGRNSFVPVEAPGGGNVLGGDADLQPLQWFSPLAALRPIGPRSAAWNTGDPGFAPPPDTDQRGEPRVVDIVDMGAFEIQQPYLLPRFTG